MTIQVGSVLGDRFEVVGFLTSGGMADVYRARDLHSDAVVAVKVLRTDVERGQERFTGEIATLRELDHPHIVRSLDAGAHDGAPFLVLDLVVGPSLAQRLEDGPLSDAEVRRTGAEIADALAYAHTHGIVHRDVKPGNVLFGVDGSAHLADFGLALRETSARITGSDEAVGTATYISPEQLTDGESTGPAADVYALGLVLLEALTGERAYPGSVQEAALARLSAPPAIPDDLGDGWVRLLRAMTAREPRQRPEANRVAAVLGGVGGNADDAPGRSGEAPRGPDANRGQSAG